MTAQILCLEHRIDKSIEETEALVKNLLQLSAMIELPVAGRLSDKPAREVHQETIAMQQAWDALGCSLPCMDFNLIPLSVIPEVRIIDRGLVHVTGMKIITLFE